MKYLFLFIILTLNSSALEIGLSDDILFVSNRYPKVSGCWVTEPAIRVCSGLNISSSRITSALNYWKRLGYSFGPVIFDNNSAACINGPLWGEIVLTLPDQSFDFSKLAITRTTKIQADNTILYSQISMQEGSVNKERVLEHEIGHALGWNHVGVRYHLMNEAWERGGHVSSGLTARIYKETCTESRF